MPGQVGQCGPGLLSPTLRPHGFLLLSRNGRCLSPEPLLLLGFCHQACPSGHTDKPAAVLAAGSPSHTASSVYCSAPHLDDLCSTGLSPGLHWPSWRAWPDLALVDCPLSSCHGLEEDSSEQTRTHVLKHTFFPPFGPCFLYPLTWEGVRRKPYLMKARWAGKVP